MRKLFILLWKYSFFVLFVMLETVSLLFLFNSYSYHRSLKFSVVSDVSGSILSTYNGITDYFSLTSVNKTLAEENAILRSLAYSLPDSADFSTPDIDSLFVFIPAKVISISVNKTNNFIMINKGKNHGVEKEMGVISSTGVVGVVVGVSNNYAVIMPMLHQNMRISGRIKKNANLVNVIWQGNNYLYGKVIDIPAFINLQKGDTIITSGNSLIFPENLMIGTVERQLENKGEDLNRADLKFSTDFNSLKYVYVIKNKNKAEQQKLMDIPENE